MQEALMSYDGCAEPWTCGTQKDTHGHKKANGHNKK